MTTLTMLGAAVGLPFCGPESIPITDPTFWNITIYPRPGEFKFFDHCHDYLYMCVCKEGWALIFYSHITLVQRIIINLIFHKAPRKIST